MSNKLTYISLFSGGGVGCYGFKEQDYICVATNEYIERRLEVQKNNSKCLYDTGYILGDITSPDVFLKLSNEIQNFKQKENIDDIDVVIATPPCQGISIANHKKNNGDIYRNSLVVDAIKIVKRIKPKFFIFENVQSFLNTKCYEEDRQLTIGEAISKNLSGKYIYHSEVLNLKDYGSNSSRTRTIVIGVRNDYSEYISPALLFPSYEKEKTLKDIIYNYPRLSEMGETHKEDIYHNFKPYRRDMRKWVETLLEGESSFDNLDDTRKPHRIINGELVINQNKNGDKYKRQEWDKVAPCIHTRNDIFASQNTIHPEDDRVFSIRELMKMMNIPESFKWSNQTIDELNNLNQDERLDFLKANEVNIRQCIGEAVPTVIMSKIAKNIKSELKKKSLSSKEIGIIIKDENLENTDKLLNFIKINIDKLHLYNILKIAELSNMKRKDNAAYYTELKTLNEIYRSLPDINKDEINILEPSAGVGNFIPFILKKYEGKKINLDLCDIDKESLKILKTLLDQLKFNNQKVKITFVNDNFLEHKFEKKYDLIIGNPPFLKLNKRLGIDEYRKKFSNEKADNISIFFLEKAIKLSNEIIMIFPKYFLHNDSFSLIRNKLKSLGLKKIIDFGEKGFNGVKIETICLCINTCMNNTKIEVNSITNNKKNTILKSKLMDSDFPNWLIYRNEFFDNIYKKLELGIFNVFRDRQITNKYLSEYGDIRVFRSRNIAREGNKLIDIESYDKYINSQEAKEFAVFDYLKRDDVYLVPNMTYYPRIVKKPINTLVNGSIAILELIEKNIKLDEKALDFINSDDFREFYSIARNKSTRSLNIDKNSVFYFGIKKDGKNENNKQ